MAGDLPSYKKKMKGVWGRENTPVWEEGAECRRVVPKIMGPFWFWIILRHSIRTKWDPNLGNYPEGFRCMA